MALGIKLRVRDGTILLGTIAADQEGALKGHKVSPVPPHLPLGLSMYPISSTLTERPFRLCR